MLVIVQYKIFLILRQRASEAPYREEEGEWRRFGEHHASPYLLGDATIIFSLPGTSLCCWLFGGDSVGLGSDAEGAAMLTCLRGNFIQSHHCFFPKKKLFVLIT